VWRVILRIGYFNDAGSALRNSIAPLLQQMGLANTDTGTWESTTVSPADAATSLAAILNVLAPATAGNGGKLEHLWVYIDRLAEG
jgi:hypothetical protein